MIDVVPTIEIRAGDVVDSRLTVGDLVAPLVTPIAASCAPVDVVEGLLRIFPFRRMHLLDRDALDGAPAQVYTTASLETRFPDVEFWVDNGASDEAAVRAWLEHRRSLLVLGSQTQTDGRLVAHYAPTERIVLSLDYRGEAGAGAADIFEQPAFWPTRVLVVTPARIGAGPDVPKLRAVKACAGDRAIYAGTGVRDARDLAALEDAGIEGGLVSSALHEGRIGAEDLAATA